MTPLVIHLVKTALFLSVIFFPLPLAKILVNTISYLGLSIRSARENMSTEVRDSMLHLIGEIGDSTATHFLQAFVAFVVLWSSVFILYF
ncbi:MAG: hypothetical protein WC511_02180 [Candidatus Pacearchaeota archaeon]